MAAGGGWTDFLVGLHERNVDQIGQPTLFPPNQARHFALSLVFHLQQDGALSARQQVPSAARNIEFNLLKINGFGHDFVAQGTGRRDGSFVRGTRIVAEIAAHASGSSGRKAQG